MIHFLYTIHIVVCLFLILVVLLQQGKGADLSVFGGGSTQTVFGARGAATLLHKMTVIGFIAFILTTISIGFVQSGGRQASVFSGVEAETEEPADAEVPEPVVPADEATADDAAAEPTEGSDGGGGS